ncbi:MAG: type II toxin-antitoxin system RelE/ParE family toxin [Pseudomonadota bacterium]
MSDLSIVIRPRADDDLDDIWLYTAREWSVAQADSYIMSLHAAFSRLSNNPEICRERTEFQPPIRLYQSGKHHVIYRVMEGQLLIMRVLHIRRDWQAEFTN